MDDGITARDTKVTYDEYLASFHNNPRGAMKKVYGTVSERKMPDYYQVKPKYIVDVIDYVESLGDMHGFCRGNIIKYIVRAGKKGNTLEDLRKAQEYLNRWIASEEHHANPLDPSTL